MKQRFTQFFLIVLALLTSAHVGLANAGPNSSPKVGTAPGTAASFELHFKNTANWGEVKVYLFNKATNAALPGWSWPGVSMTREGSSQWYKYTVNESVEVGIVFNNNNQGKQSADLFRTTTGWYDGTWHNACPGDCPVVPVPVLTASPLGGTYYEPIQISLAATNGGSIYYTLDGSTPTSASTPYTGSIGINADARLRAVALNAGGSSNLIDQSYTFAERTPFAIHFKNTNNWAQVYVYLFNKTTNSALPGWTWPGKAMTREADSQWFAYTVNESAQVGIVFNNNNQGQQSPDLTRSTNGWYAGAWYDACPGDCPVYPVPVLTATPTPGSYMGSVSVSLSATQGGAIYYTTNGQVPTTASTPYSTALQITSTTRLMAKAFNQAGASNLIDATYTITGPVPVVSIAPAAGTYPNAVTVVLAATEGGSIYYTTNGSTPSAASTPYTGAFELTQSATVKAIAINANGASAVVSADYVVEIVSPLPVVSISPASGSYLNKVTVSISATNQGAIYYTTNGSQPTAASTPYTAAFDLTADATVRAIAINSHGSSEVKSATYTVRELVNDPTNKFTWDNALVYFVMTDRFANGDPTNDHAYGRGFDGNGNAYETAPYASSNAGMFHGGDIRGLIQKLQEGYFERIGVNAIWITAPYEQAHGWVGGGPNGDFVHYPYHGYYTLDWTEMDAAMGTKADFQTFVDLAHSKGIRVVMDIVLNHVGYTTFADGEQYGYGCWSDAWKGWRPSTPTGWHDYHTELVDYSCANWGNYWGDEWVRHPNVNGYDACSPGGGISNCVGFLPDIKTETTTNVGLPPILVEKWTQEGTLNQKIAAADAWFAKTGLAKTPANYIIYWITEWIRQYGVDGLRVDTAKHVELEIWKRLKEQGSAALAEWKAANPDKAPDNLPLWMTAEVWGHGPNKSEYHAYGFNSVINFGLKTDARLSRTPALMESLFAGYAANINSDPNFNVLSYISSHDVTPLFPRERLKEIAPAFVLLPGGVQIFYGDECARPEGPYADAEQNTRSDFDWSGYDNETLEVFEVLGRFRKKHPAIGAGSHTKLADAPYFFMRDYENAELKMVDRVAVAIGAAGATTLDVSAVFANGEVVIDAYTGAEYTVAAGKITVNPHSEGIILLEYKNPPVYQIKPVVAISPKGMYSEEPIQISIAASDEKGRAFTTYYTTDDSHTTDNLSAWNVYTAPFSLGESATVRAIAEAADGVRSTLKAERFAVGAIQPFLVHVWSPGGVPKIYTWDAQPAGITPNMVWPGVAMTAEGTDGWYVAAIPALSSKVIFIINGKQSANLERDREGWYKDGQWYDACPGTCPGPQVPLLSISPAGKNFSDGSGQVSIVGINAQAIYYTTDGSTPSELSTPYTGAFVVSGDNDETVVVKAIAYNQAGASAVASQSYTFENITGFTVYYWSPTCVPNVHIWNALPEGSQAATTWPGLKMTAVGETGWYSYHIPSKSANVIFNSCTGQTANLSRSTDGWYRAAAWSDACTADCPEATQKSFRVEPELESIFNLRVFPNPTAGALFVELSELRHEASVQIATLSGQLMLERSLDAAQSEVDLSHLPKGIYVLKVKHGEQLRIEKIVLK